MELLVVIGVIAVLVGLLIPALAGARRMARDATCRSNLRQVHQALLLYANQNRDQVPIGYRRTKQFNSMIYSGTAQAYVLFGKLHEARLTWEGDIYFCPAETNPQFMHDVPQNPWPPGEGENQTANTYSGYACRPVTELPDDWGAPPPDLEGFRLPRLARLGNVALLADLMNSPDRLDTRHVTYVNVVWIDASVGRVERWKFAEPLEQSPPPSFPPDTQWDPLQEEIWEILDRR